MLADLNFLFDGIKNEILISHINFSSWPQLQDKVIFELIFKRFGLIALEKLHINITVQFSHLSNVELTENIILDEILVTLLEMGIITFLHDDELWL